MGLNEKKKIVQSLKSAGYSIKTVCEALGISRSSYYRIEDKKEGKKKRPPKKDENEVLQTINKIKGDHLFWGYRRVWAWLRFREKRVINQKRVYRIMKENGLLVSITQYKAKRKPGRSKPKATKINQFWGTDMTKFLVQGVGWVYLVVVLDWYSKKVVGYKLDLRSRSHEWAQALEMAVHNQCPKGSRGLDIKLISDNGSQPTRIAYMKACNTLGITQIMTSYSNPKGNAETERFMRTFKEETVWPYEFESFEQAKKKVDKFIGFYNDEYPNSAIGYLSPNEFERAEKLKAVA
ncbi:MAG: IS3 family transposase [Desulfonauticus sp.]|nr:IS3 family transposase [Desulfonauticus sp.]